MSDDEFQAKLDSVKDHARVKAYELDDGPPPDVVDDQTPIARARRALAKVAYSSEKAKAIAEAERALPDVTIMAGANLILSDR